MLTLAGGLFEYHLILICKFSTFFWLFDLELAWSELIYLLFEVIFEKEWKIFYLIALCSF